MTTLEPGGVIRAASLPVPLEALPHAQVEAGAPRAGSVALAAFEGLEVGVWEHTPGVSTDVEIDEVFVVLSGAARIDMVEPEGESLEVGPGDVVRLVAGQRTRWTVTETLRKIYLA
ncbi:cupin domain-containing protein [Demequina zhanjiangensis]|uniref:Cupin domain-containing protein n=1 Tax=Demequina zhanjiangensis TaxID=3051659 RepID=A0ABT8G2G0_9MICO|nr:cupin domain-containing protein [Demequina sp. SYSU T00b26]MDN4472879.1 cupin domain-containing protein [Demequina sp. SYSU T00b26]